MAIMLDADVVIRAEKGTFGLKNWVASSPKDQFEIAAITVAELWHGMERATGTHKITQQRYLNAVLESLPIIPYTEQTAYEHARIWAALEASGKMIGFYDLIVGATALANPSNVSTLMHGAEMRGNAHHQSSAAQGLWRRPLLSRRAWLPFARSRAFESRESSAEPHTRNGVADLDCATLAPNLVKAYAADFCGTQSLKDANRELNPGLHFSCCSMRKRRSGRIGLQAEFLYPACGGEVIRHQIPGLNSRHQDSETKIDGLLSFASRQLRIVASEMLTVRIDERFADPSFEDSESAR
jgi:tRNA(fMet)-specific endonuclease VapC